MKGVVEVFGTRSRGSINFRSTREALPERGNEILGGLTNIARSFCLLGRHPADTSWTSQAANDCAAQGRSSREDCNEVIPNLCSLLVIQQSAIAPHAKTLKLEAHSWRGPVEEAALVIACCRREDINGFFANRRERSGEAVDHHWRVSPSERSHRHRSLFL